MAKKQTVYWTYQGKEVKNSTDMPSGVVGYIYIITNNSNGKKYIGRKTVFKPNRKKLPVCPEYPWKSYCGSSKELLADIKKGHVYTKEILRYCYSKAELTYYESQTIFCEGALEDETYYNYWIKCTVYSKNLKK